MNKIVDFLKGIPIGMANVVPGFSGGTMAVILNIYERFINAFSDILHHPIRVIKDVWALFLGTFFGIIAAITVIAFLLKTFPIPTSMFFAGLIVGSIPKMFDYTKKQKIKVRDAIVFFICVIVVITLPIVGEGPATDYTFNSKIMIIIFFLALIASSTMVIPGVSGSLILLTLGYYDLIWVDVIGSFLDSIRLMKIDSIFQTIVPIIPFALGAIFGLVFISKLIRMLMRKYPQTVYHAILGLLVASPFAIIYGMYQEYPEQIKASNWVSFVVGIFTLILGAILTTYLSKYERIDKNEQTKKS